MAVGRIKIGVSGLVVVDKPRGITSRMAVDRVIRAAGRVRAGHAGTLDPLASGVLVVCLGSATRLVEEVQAQPKSYRTVVRLGARSDTLDADGQVEEAIDPRPPSREELEAAIGPMVGEVDQVPPGYSALKVGGRRAYDLARTGQAVILAARRVRIDRIGIVRYEWPYLELEVDCGSGTYIRSIARDVGEAVGCGGLVDVLIRTRIGPFVLDDAISVDALTPETLAAAIRPTVEATAGMPRRSLDPDEIAAIAAGRSIAARPGIVPGPMALVDANGGLVAIAEVTPDLQSIRPRKVLMSQ